MAVQNGVLFYPILFGESIMASQSESTSNPRILFLRVGWMQFYDGQTENDRIQGGGGFVAEHGYGHEIYNFRQFGGSLYGYVQPKSSAGEYDTGRIAIERLGAEVGAAQINDVLVVWVATNPDGGTFIVGWYANATVFRESQPALEGANREQFRYYVSTSASSAHLLRLPERNFQIPVNTEGGMGRSNVWYADDAIELRRHVLNYIENRQLPIVHHAEQVGAPMQTDPLLRCMVEQVAVETTVSHFEQLGYRVRSCEKENKGWDLDAVSEFKVLQLEVKGLSSDSIVVELTPNEYEQLMN